RIARGATRSRTRARLHQERGSSGRAHQAIDQGSAACGSPRSFGRRALRGACPSRSPFADEFEPEPQMIGGWTPAARDDVKVADARLSDRVELDAKRVHRKR